MKVQVINSSSLDTIYIVEHLLKWRSEDTTICRNSGKKFKINRGVRQGDPNNRNCFRLSWKVIPQTGLEGLRAQKRRSKPKPTEICG